MPRYVYLDDPADPRLEPFANIRERDLVGRQQQFIAEGEVVLKVLVGSPRFAILSCLIAEQRLGGLRSTLDRVPAETEIYVVPAALMSLVAGFPIHRGVLALGRKPPQPALDVLLAGLPERALVVVAVGIANHDNIGGIFRNAAAFGADAVLLDRTSCDPFYRKAIRVSVGGVFRVPSVIRPLNELLTALDASGFASLALTPAAGNDLDDEPCGARMAVFFGAEGPGLPETVLHRCRAVGIEMQSRFDSLNVATASGIVLHRFAKRAI